jgi:hypothetical protein
MSSDQTLEQREQAEREFMDTIKRIGTDDKPVHITQGEHGITATNAQPSKYGRWVSTDHKDGTSSFTFRLNKKGKHRVARRGEL